MIAISKAAGLALVLLLCTTRAQASVEISSAPTQNMNCSAGVCTPTAKDAVLNVSDLATMLGAGDVTVVSQKIARDIHVRATLTWSSASRLTLDSYRSVTFKRPVKIAGAGSLAIQTSDGGKHGDYRFVGQGHVEFLNASGNLEINGDAYALIRSLGQLKTEVAQDNRGHHALAKSLDVAKRTYGYSPVGGIFYGVFEGLGNTISNLTIVHDGALFERLCYYLGDGSCVIRDVGLIAANINGSGYSAALVVTNVGLIENCFATGRVSVPNQSSAFAGGLVNDNAGIVENSYAEVAVSGTTAGGLVGINNSFCGQNSCEQPGLIIGSYSLGPVSGYNAGGVVGVNLDAQIVNSYSFGQVAGIDDAGGVVGLYTGDHDTDLLTNSYSTGAITGGAFVGGLVGKDEVQANIANTYWDLNTSGIGDPTRGAGNVSNDPGITGLTDAQLKSGLPAGFDSKIWAQNASINHGYPYLIANPPR